jgi:two-component system, chemotaxis family, response regulator Rcp1
MGETNGNSTHVLIVEDNRADVRVLRMALAVEKDWRLEIDVAEDGEKAIAYLLRQAPYEQKERPDLVILDLNLPKYNGAEVMHAIQGEARLRSMVVIVLSSAPTVVLRDRLQDAGVTAEACLTKPFEFKDWMRLGKEIRSHYLGVESRRCAAG